MTGAFLFAGGLGVYDAWMSRLTSSFILSGTLFVAGLLLASAVLELPFQLYGDFRIEQRHGFNRQTAALWWGDWLKSTALSLLLSGGLTAGAVTLVQASPNTWWIWVSALITAVSLLMTFLSSYVIEPLFNKMEPLDVAGLSDGIRSMTEKSGLHVGRVLKIDASRRSSHSNAYFTGLGRVKRVVLFDTLLAQMSHSQILAVLAHELGHWKKHHVLFRMLTMQVLLVVGAYLAFLLAPSSALPQLVGLGSASFAARVVILMMASSVLLFPLAFLALVLSKGHSVAKSSLVPAVVHNDGELVEANSRLSLIAVIASVAGGLPAAGLVALFDARFSLLLASLMFVVAGVLATRIPSAPRPANAETVEERAEMAIPSIVFAGSAMAVMRGCVGFLTFLLAFLLKQQGEDAWVFGLVLASSALGGFIGVILTPRLRRVLREESMLAGSLLIPALVALVAARDGETLGAVAIGFAVAAGAATGRIAFDSLVHRDGPEHLRGRAFARFETRFQLAWVAGALIPVALLDVLSQRWGFFVLALVLFFAGLSYVAGLRARGEWGPPGRNAPHHRNTDRSLDRNPPELGDGNGQTP